MNPRAQASRPGFTLVELLVVVGILGILVAIAVPAFLRTRGEHEASVDSHNASEIAKTYAAFSEGTNIGRTISPPRQISRGNAVTSLAARNINDVAFILSKYSGLNDASFWFTKSDDQLAGQAMPRVVISGKLDTATTTAPDFQSCHPKAWAFVIGLPITAPVTTTPLLWTYGLQHSGQWGSQSPWHGKGGYIAFLDGHVEWFDKLTKDAANPGLVVYQGQPNAGAPTSDFNDAINSQGSTPAQVVNVMGNGQ